MSAIFKTRKVPKHLIIQDEIQLYRHGRFSLIRLVLETVVPLLLTGLILVAAQYGLAIVQSWP